MLTPEEKARIEEYCEKATAGPWHEDGKDITCDESFHSHGHLRNSLGYSNASYTNKVCEIYGNTIPPVDDLDPIVPAFNRHFIVNARTDLPFVISSLREAQERIGKLEEALEFISGIYDDQKSTIENSQAMYEASCIARAALEGK